mmetsp:Transcript_39219/g.98653  ORF Transcript_39219/g.98653 Transcript_39219/m.98653 type:complete len:494 (-) Transcript_39219:13-1494(-)
MHVVVGARAFVRALDDGEKLRLRAPARVQAHGAADKHCLPREVALAATRRGGGLAKVACSARVTEGRRLAEELADHGAPAPGGARIGEGAELVEGLTADLFLLLVEVPRVEVAEVLVEVAVAVEHNTPRWQPIAASSPHLLVVLLEGLGRAVVDDAAEVGLVDAHAEGHGGDHNAQGASQETPVCVLSLLHRQARVVQADFEPGELQYLRHEVADGLDLVHGRRVDNRRLVALREVLCELPEVLREALPLADGDVEVGAVDRGDALDMEPRHLAQPQGGEDVLPHARGRRGRQREDGDVGHCVADPVELPIAWAEVMTPLRDAMGLIHGDGAKLVHAAEVPQECVETVRGSLLGRRVDQQVSTRGRPSFGACISLRRAQEDSDLACILGVDCRYLILHQGDQRGDHDDGLACVEGRELVANRLPRTRAPNDRRILALKHGLHHLLLAFAEGIVPEDAAECYGGVRSLRGRRHGLWWHRHGAVGRGLGAVGAPR